jgi:4-amino-4-deoxy-L-arabinose transferase-like glycosyltransferase
VKLVATLPMLHMQLKRPQLQQRNFKIEAYLDGKDLLFKNNANQILLQVRLAAAFFTLLLALLVFCAGKEMFGTAAGFIALALLVFDPNILAHGAVVTTDVGITCFMFATVYAFYRYNNRPSVLRLVVTGIALGLALGAKHTGILVFPMLVLLAICELLLGPRREDGEAEPDESRGAMARRMTVAILAISAIGLALLWGFYGFRYQARPDGLQMNPSLSEVVGQISRPREARVIQVFARYHLLPESYLMGLADVRNMSDFYQSYVLGKIYPHGVWFYFPLAFLIKSTTAFLILLAIAIVAIASGKLRKWREILFLALPALFHLYIAMISRMNIGVRHILPLYAFFAVLIGGAVWALIERHRVWAYVVGVLLAYQAVTAVRMYPAYMAYANEFWGGPTQTWKLLSDSNVDWAQQLKATKRYIDKSNIHDCWIIYFAQPVVDLDYYGIPCRILPTMDAVWMNEDIDTPAEIDGPLFFSAGDLSGFEFGPGKLNPYEEFKTMKPVASIDYGIYVYEGHFKIPRAAALSHQLRAKNLLAANKAEAALQEAQQAVALAPDYAQGQLVLGDALAALKRTGEALPAYQRALELARTIEPEFQQATAKSARQGIDKTSGSQ